MVLKIFIEGHIYEVIPGCIKMFSAPTLNWKYESASVKYWVSGGIIADIVDYFQYATGWTQVTQ